MSKATQVPLESHIRKTIQEQRLALSREEICSKSRAVIQHFQSCVAKDLSRFQDIAIGLYSSFSFEVDLSSLVAWCSNQGATLFYPRVGDVLEAPMRFIEMGLTQGHLKEPIHSNMRIQNIHKSNLDVIFVPGVVFGEHGERIGMGKGYYDRYLAGDQSAVRIALAFDFQVLPSIPQKKTDQPMHWIVTESREFRAPQLENHLNRLRHRIGN